MNGKDSNSVETNKSSFIPTKQSKITVLQILFTVAYFYILFLCDVAAGKLVNPTDDDLYCSTTDPRKRQRLIIRNVSIRFVEQEEFGFYSYFSSVGSKRQDGGTLSNSDAGKNDHRSVALGENLLFAIDVCALSPSPHKAPPTFFHWSEDNSGANSREENATGYLGDSSSCIEAPKTSFNCSGGYITQFSGLRQELECEVNFDRVLVPPKWVKLERREGDITKKELGVQALFLATSGWFDSIPFSLNLHIFCDDVSDPTASIIAYTIRNDGMNDTIQTPSSNGNNTDPGGYGIRYNMTVLSFLACSEDTANEAPVIITVTDVILGVVGGFVFLVIVYTLGMNYFMYGRRGWELLTCGRSRSAINRAEYNVLEQREVAGDEEATDLGSDGE